jgi:hypothetical protein
MIGTKKLYEFLKENEDALIMRHGLENLLGSYGDKRFDTSYGYITTIAFEDYWDNYRDIVGTPLFEAMNEN